MKDSLPVIIPPDSEGLYLFPTGYMLSAMKGRSHPYSPCNECLAKPANCEVYRHIDKCQPVADYYNALIHKEPTIVCTFIINSHGVGEPFLFNGSKNCTIEDLIQASMGKKNMSNGSVFDYNKHLEYTKYLESLEYYNLL
ncbi:hypothetical protein [uncultured Desulfosarcina sp.]|uniref:hypothetical protein n=1 Tax=uncultured Desulfosarcina sp. TaxID=218289 RepID=UPI0029C930C6|nr:hypothetical protein [uncultured Desulfosarcina sp.]